jgi:hypothetical protein
MKSITFKFLIILFFAQCSSNTISPEISKINGTWKLFKIESGFPPPNGPATYEPTYIETLEINSLTKVLKRTNNSKLVEETEFEIKPYKISESVSREALYFLKSNTYSFLDFEKSNTVIKLYQKTGVGSQLADGSSFYFKKM